MERRGSEVGLDFVTSSRSFERCPSLDYGIGPHRAVDVLEVLLAKISELDPDLASDLIVGRRRDADATRFGDALKPGRNVNAVSKDVVGLDNYVANIDAYAESNTPVFYLAECKFMNAGLKLNGSSNSLNRARKLRQEPVASVLHDAAAVFGNRGLDTLREERGQLGMRGLFVMVHEP